MRDIQTVIRKLKGKHLYNVPKKELIRLLNKKTFLTKKETQKMLSRRRSLGKKIDMLQHIASIIDRILLKSLNTKV